MNLNKNYAIAVACVLLGACGGTPANAQQNAVEKQNVVKKVENQPVVVAEDVAADVVKAITTTLETNYADQGLKFRVLRVHRLQVCMKLWLTASKWFIPMQQGNICWLVT